MPWKAFMQSSALTNSDNVEHTLFRLCIALVQSAKYLVYAFIGCFNVLIGILLMLQDFQLMIFHRFQTTKNRSIVWPQTCYYLLLHSKVVLLAFKPLLHNLFFWKERKINCFIAVIVLLLTKVSHPKIIG